MEKKYARLAALLTAAVLCGNGAPSMAADWWVGDGAKTITITAASEITGDVYGNHDTIDTTTGAVTGHVEMTGGTVNGEINGGYSSSSGYGGEVSGNTVTITGGTVTEYVYGGRINVGAATGNRVTITGGTVGTVDNSNGIYGGCSSYGGEVSGNTVTITGGTVGTVDSSSSVYGGCSSAGAATGNRVTITDGTVNNGIYGGWGRTDATNNRVTITGGTVKGNVYGGRMENGNASGNTVTISGGTVGTVDSSRSVYGGYSASTSGKVSGNTVTITGGIVTGDVYGGYSYGDSVTGNTVALSGDANVEKAALYGWKLTDEKGGAPAETADNDLIIDDWTGSTQSVKNFETIRFQGVTWVPNGTILTITNGEKSDLENTKIDAENLVIHGSTPQVGEAMTFIEGDNLGIQEGNVDVADTFTAGVTAVGTGSAEMDGEKKLVYKISNVERNRQTDLIAENRAVAAAFVNQGADIAADSLRLLDDGYHFGTQTFGAVYGNRSQYDVASDIKINGWSEIAGFGNIHEVKGGRLAWGVFYENGTGNYRTWNTFNNEMFRGDGSLLYNGGGAAVRLTKDSGMYYEASFRAGTLSSSMSNAVKDGNGNSYGFDSDSTYWGAHIGAGKLIQRGSGQWDIYGKYFHTDIDGDSFEIGGDRFSFDDVTSDRLRIGARYTADTDKVWSLYCGAAYEYEFSGDSRMKAGQFEAPEQSLQGSTVFGEIGTVWGRKDSPWSMDVNLRGYAGEREGFSGMVQLAYAF